MSRYTLLTGATGLLGRYLLRDLLLRNERVAVLARRTPSESVRERVESIVQVWERQLQQYLPRPQYIEGDVCQPNCGLAESDCVWIRRNCRRVLHAIGQATAAAPSKDAGQFQANVDSVRWLLELCRKCGIGDLHYVSTASVSGIRQGVVQENELDEGQAFHDAYEQSRFEAEWIVRQDEQVRRRTVYRPSLITGDSTTGFSCRRDELSASIQFLAADHDARTPAAMGLQSQHLTPVDWVSESICQLLEEPRAWGRTFHLCPDQPTTLSEVADAVAGFFHDRNDRDVLACDDAAVGVPFRDQLPTYDCTNLRKFAGISRCPQLDTEMIWRYCQYGQSNGWGRAADSCAQVPRWSDAVVSFARTDVIDAFIDGIASTSSTTLGLDVVGSGGGQWSLHRGPTDLLTVTPGLPSPQAPVVRVTTSELTRLLEAPCERWSA